MLRHIGRVSTPKLVPRDCPKYLQTTLIMGEGGLISEFMWGIVGLRKRVPHRYENRDLVRDKVPKQLVGSGSNLGNTFPSIFTYV